MFRIACSSMQERCHFRCFVRSTVTIPRDFSEAKCLLWRLAPEVHLEPYGNFWKLKFCDHKLKLIRAKAENRRFNEPQETYSIIWFGRNFGSEFLTILFSTSDESIWNAGPANWFTSLPKCDWISIIVENRWRLIELTSNALEVDASQKLIDSFDSLFLLFSKFSISRRLGVSGIGKRFVTAFGLSERKRG